MGTFPALRCTQRKPTHVKPGIVDYRFRAAQLVSMSDYVGTDLYRHSADLCFKKKKKRLTVFTWVFEGWFAFQYQNNTLMNMGRE